MKHINIIIIIFSIVFVSCNNNAYYNNKTSLNSLNDTFYHLNNIYGWYELDTIKLKGRYYLTKYEINTPIKEKDFDYFRLKNKYKYYLVDSFEINKYKYKIITFISDGENDTKELNIKLNSYNESGEILDALLLDNRFTFEVEYFRNYLIDIPNKYILLHKYSIDHLLYTEDGDILAENTVPDTHMIEVKYQISKQGKFEKIE